MPGGYFLNNLNTEKAFSLTAKTEYTFTDKNSGNSYTTTKTEEFSEYLDMMQSEPKVPYSIQEKNGKVISVTEMPKYVSYY